MPARTRNRVEKVPSWPTLTARASATSQCGVSVAGLIRFRTVEVHSVTNQVRPFPPAERPRPRPLIVTTWPLTRPRSGDTLTERFGPAATAGPARRRLETTATPSADACADHWYA